MPDRLTYSASCMDYWYNSNVNTTLLGIETKIASKKMNAAIFNGIAYDTKSGASMIVDLKLGHNYDKNAIVGQNLRIRNNFGDGSISTQFRYSPCTVNVPVAENTSVYLNPHAVAKYNFTSKNWDAGAGAFLGVTQKFKNNLSISLEGQRYNIQNPSENRGNWGVNVILSKTL